MDVEFPERYMEEMSDFFKGLRRMDAEERQDGTRKAKQGKDDLPFPVLIGLILLL